MATYLVLNLVFLVIVMAGLHLLKALRRNRNVLMTIGILLVATAIFDSLIVAFGIVAYDEALISGIYIGQAPVEDFFYAILAGAMIPAVWQITGRRQHGGR